MHRKPKICTNMPVRRGHVAPQNTFLGTIIRKFEGQSKFSLSIYFATVVCLILLMTKWTAAPDYFKFVAWEENPRGEEGIPRRSNVVFDLECRLPT